MQNVVVKNLHKSFNGKKILNGVNLSVEASTSCVIIGRSGEGKSVLLKSIIGIIDRDSGSVVINGFNMDEVEQDVKVSVISKCGFLFQSGALFDSLSVHDNIVFFAKRLFGLSEKDSRDLSIEMLESVGLRADIINLFPVDLSGGMRKRVALARSIAINPEIMFFDEPTTGLDPIMSNVINNLIIKACRERGITCITITHDMNSVRQIADNVALLHHGKIIWQDKIDMLDKVDHELVRHFVDGTIDGE